MDIAEHALDEGLPKYWPKTLARLHDKVDIALRGAIPDDVLRHTATVRAVVAIANDFGGRAVYLPRGDVLQRALRDARIWQLVMDHGWTDERVGNYYGLTDRQCRTIRAEQRALRMPAIQPDMFGPDVGSASIPQAA